MLRKKKYKKEEEKRENEGKRYKKLWNCSKLLANLAFLDEGFPKKFFEGRDFNSN